MAPNISGSLFHVTLLEFFLNRLPDIRKVCAPLSYSIFEGIIQSLRRHAVAQLVQTLCYKPEGRGFPMV